MKRVELTVPLALLEDLGILSGRFFRHNESVEILQTFGVRPNVAALFVRVLRRGAFKGPEAVKREARQIAKRYRLERFEVLSSDPQRGEYVAWIEYRIPAILREVASGDLVAGVVPVELAKAGPNEVRAVLLASETALPRLKEVLDGFAAEYRVRAVRAAPAAMWQPLAHLTTRQRELLQLAYRLGYFDTPAKVPLDRLAGLVGISKAALSKHLRVAERKVLAAALRHGRTEAGRLSGIRSRTRPAGSQPGS